MLSPTFDSWIDQGAASKYGYKFDVSKATSLLQSAGFTKNSSGVMQDSAGHKLSFNVITIAGYTDWDATLQVVADSLLIAEPLAPAPQDHRAAEQGRSRQNDDCQPEDPACLLLRDGRHGPIAARPRRRFVTEARRLGAERLRLRRAEV